MSITKLYLFSKNTDATFGVRGFQYQIIKTLQTWLTNYLNNVDEVIYCDYEEDIFQRNDSIKNAKFRQVKLYKTNFSFKSEEVQKAIAHFFMLHVKSDYQDWNKEFVFEANSSVSASRGDNEADLLQRWAAGQASPSGELLAECSAKVKSFVTAYIKAQAAKLAESEDPATIADALLVLSKIQEKEWQDFTRCIRWEFAGIDPSVEFASALTGVEDLVKELPFKLSDSRQHALIGILHQVVSLKSAAPDPADRALTLAEMEHHILAGGSADEQWYLGVFEKWQPAAPAGMLYPGELLEIINAANYCRWEDSLAGHTGFWQAMLRGYISQKKALPSLRRSAVYEYLFLQMRPTGYFTPPSGTMQGSEEYIRFYFEDFRVFKDPAEFENAQSLLFLVVSAYRLRRTGVNKAEIIAWLKGFGDALADALATAPTPSARCRLLTCHIANQFFAIRSHNVAEKIAALQPLAKELVAQLPRADHFNVTHLSEQLDVYTLILVRAGLIEYEPMIDELREINLQLAPFVDERSGAHRRAKALVAKGAEYLRQDKPAYTLLALRDFHSAKDLWNNKEAAEGFMLALRQIAHLYLSLGLNLAAKYYALGAAWVCAQSDGGKLSAQVPEALALVFHADFQQGAWLGATANFEGYIQMRYSLDPEELDLRKEPTALHAVGEFSLLVYAAPQVSASFNDLVQKQLDSYPAEIRDQLITPCLESYRANVPAAELPQLLTRKLIDSPLSDGGAERTIVFRALGSLWRLTFSNTYRVVPMAEEFAAQLQILVAEVALSKVDFHLPKGEVELHLTDAKKWRAPKRLPSNKRYAWEIALRHFDSPDPEQIKRATVNVSATLMAVLDEMSVLPHAEFEAAYVALFEKSGLATKNLFANAYQRMYRYFLSAKRYNALRHKNHKAGSALPGSALPSLPAEREALQWRSDISSKYSREQAIDHIRQRFRGSTRCIHITLTRLKQRAGYDEWLQKLREEGWLDWQIVQAMANYMLTYKVTRQLKARKFASAEEYEHALRVGMGKMSQLDEQECYTVFPLEAFKTKEFSDQLEMDALFVLRSYGLENKSQTPNFEAIRDLLSVRFRLQADNTDEDNPFLLTTGDNTEFVNRLIEKDWASARSVRFVSDSDNPAEPAAIVLVFAQHHQGIDGYELLLDFYQNNQASIGLSTVGARMNLSIETEGVQESLVLRNLVYRPEELAAFQANVPADSSFMFMVGFEHQAELIMSASREPFSPLLIKDYQYEGPTTSNQIR
ncbi:dsDNA nuclease domain-containing protein [Hymenobacter sp. DG01]|uniref:dsDNA nuclease domain-containing protein n=1 Tax=Hymenobacter sp. DG01 TaxID=2584940 RepID=UPI00112392EB|nr:dsDNA nuclease domain-containing protein [Hymenobacter sp. DG01]